MTTLYLDTKINNISVGYMISHKMVKLILNLIKSNSDIVLAEDIEEVLTKINPPYLIEMITINQNRKKYSFVSISKGVYSSSEGMKINYNSYYSGRLNPGIRYGY